MLKKHYPIGGPNLVRKLLSHISKWLIEIKRKELDLYMNKNNIIRKNSYKCNINYQLFKNVLSPEFAYFLGLLWADGSIYGGNDKK